MRRWEVSGLQSVGPGGRGRLVGNWAGNSRMGALADQEPPLGKMAKQASHWWRFHHLLFIFFLKCPSMPPSFAL